MHPTIRNILAIVAGLVVGSIVNMGLITMSGHVIAPPAGADVTTVEGLKASIHLFEPKHFIFPFLAHALGTFVGAAVAAFLGASRNVRLAMAVGALFFAGGAANVAMLPAPVWFDALDLIAAYFPMAWIGWKMTAAKAQPVTA
jgi:hypothetical protein